MSSPQTNLEAKPSTQPRKVFAGAFLMLCAASSLLGATETVAIYNSSEASDHAPAHLVNRIYPLHTDIVSTTFWVGEMFDPNAADGSQMISTYDSSWFSHYGGCDGVMKGAGVKACSTEKRTVANGYFPTQMTPKQNPFYLDLPFDDLNEEKAFARRAQVIPWANDPGYAGHAADENFSYMKNRWVRIIKGDRVCYAQIEDAGPGKYNDAEYVFGLNDARSQNKRFNGAGMDVSPAVNGYLNFDELDGDNDRVSWQFVEFEDVPAGPWKKIVTTQPVQND